MSQTIFKMRSLAFALIFIALFAITFSADRPARVYAATDDGASGAPAQGAGEPEELPLHEQIFRRSATLFGQAGYPGGEEVFGYNRIAVRVGVLLNTALMLTGLVFLALTVYSGIQWMSAGGNEETVEKARTRIKRAVLGLIIVMGAWVLTAFVIRAVSGPVRYPSGGPVEFGRILR